MTFDPAERSELFKDVMRLHQEIEKAQEVGMPENKEFKIHRCG